MKQVSAVAVSVSPAKNKPVEPIPDFRSGVPFHGANELQPWSHQVILRVNVIFGNEHRCESFRVSGADRTQLNTKLATKALSILSGSIFLSVRSWSDPEVSFVVDQQVTEVYPADSRGVVL